MGIVTFEEYKKKAFADDPKLYEEYKAIKPEYEIIRQIIKTRNELNFTQKEFAEKIGIKQSNIGRLENGDYNPSLGFLKKITKGLGKELHIEFR